MPIQKNTFRLNLEDCGMKHKESNDSSVKCREKKSVTFFFFF